MTLAVSWKKSSRMLGRNVTSRTMMSCNQRWAHQNISYCIYLFHSGRGLFHRYFVRAQKNMQVVWYFTHYLLKSKCSCLYDACPKQDWAKDLWIASQVISIWFGNISHLTAKILKTNSQRIISLFRWRDRVTYSPFSIFSGNATVDLLRIFLNSCR